jgi:hypothetical protein
MQADNETRKTNKLTQKAGLFINVNNVRGWMKRFFTNSELYISKSAKSDSNDESVNDTKPEDVKDAKDAKDKDKSSDPSPKFNGAHVALASITEALTSILVKETLAYLDSDKSGLYSISEKAIRNAVLLNADLRHLFLRQLETFKPHMMYIDQFFLSHTDITSYIDRLMGRNICIDKKAYNLLAYLLLSFVIDIAKSSYHTMIYAHKKSLDFNVIKCGIYNTCTGNTQQTILIKLEDTKLLYKADDKEQEDEGEVESADAATAASP